MTHIHTWRVDQRGRFGARMPIKICTECCEIDWAALDVRLYDLLMGFGEVVVAKQREAIIRSLDVLLIKP